MRHNFFFQCDVHHLTDIKAIVLFEEKKYVFSKCFVYFRFNVNLQNTYANIDF